MIANMFSNKKTLTNCNRTIYQNQKNKHFSCFYYTILFFCTKNIRLNSRHYFIIKIPNKREFQQIVINQSSDIDFKVFMNLCEKCTAKPYSFLVNNTTLLSDSFLHFRRNLLERA